MIEVIARDAAINFKQSQNPDQQEVFVDPVTALLFIKIITSLVSLIKKCSQVKSGNEIQEIAYKQPPREMALMKRTIRRHVGFVNWFLYKKHYTNAILQAGKDTLPSEIQSVLNQS